MKPKQLAGIQGILTIREIDKATGATLSEFSDKNVITEKGMNALWKRLSLDDTNDDYRFSAFYLGEDYGAGEDTGDWSIFLPRPAKKNFTDMNQQVIYQVDPTEMVYSFPDENVLEVATLLDGKNIMDTLFPNEVNAKYNSATLRVGNGTVFSYKRFGVRSISRLIDIQVIWTFTLMDSSLYDCSIEPPPVDPPQMDHDHGIPVYAGYWGDNSVRKINSVNQEVWSYTGHINWVTDLTLDDVFVYSASRDFSIKKLRQSDGTEEWSRQIHTDVIRSIKYHNEYIYSCGNDSTVMKMDRQGNMIWIISGDTADAMDLAFMPSGNILVGYRNGNVYEIDDATGTLVTAGAFDTKSSELVAIATDSVGNCYASVFDTIFKVKKFNTSRGRDWEKSDFTDFSHCLVVDANDVLYVGSDDNTVRKIDPTGSEIWKFERHTDIVRGLDVDYLGYVYSGSIDQTVRKITPNGNQVWVFVGNENACAAIAAGLKPVTGTP